MVLDKSDVNVDKITPSKMMNLLSMLQSVVSGVHDLVYCILYTTVQNQFVSWCILY